ncbi:MAG TPA: family 78 glycoside hydrolase catalytic domain, partial [Beutenbergiaceae bacterium]|nr:family 78 glycoside hydrolase catalytic domain [Beutenbergiaceae bacterium]
MSTSEEVVLHSLRVSHEGEVLFHSTFEDDNPFNGGTTLVEDGLLVKDQVNVVWVPPVHLPLLRKEFSLEDGKEVASARIYASAKGIYELSLNGKTVGDHKLAPGFTDYEHRVHYQTYDVTDLLTSGENAVGAWLADGWYTGHIAWFGNRLYGERNSLIAQLHVTYTDGSSQIVATDDTWKTDAGPVVEADLLMGETYDANYEQPGWDAPDFDDVTWGEVWVDSSDATELLRPQPDNPVRVVEEVQATSRTEVDGAYIYDFEQNLTGVPRITISGEEGETVKLRHAEVLNPDGSIYTENLRSAKATDYYTFAEDETITYAPRFTQHGFRYLEISGVDNPPEASDVVAEVFSSDLEQTGTFTTSSDMLNQLQSNIFWGQRGNFISVPTDTPARDERLGYTGDLLAFIGTATFNMDSVAFVKKWMRDMRDTQERIGSGAYPDSAPRGPNQSCCTIGTAWADAGVVVPWTTWQRSGDLSIVEENWESMEWFMGHLAQEFPDLIRVDGPFGDWLNLSDSTPDEVLGTAFYAYVSGLMADMAYALGETDRGDHYSALETDIRDVFVDEFIYPNGKIHGDSQTAYALSLGMGLVPEDLQDEVGERFEEKLADRDHHLSTGFVGTPWLLPALSAVDNWDSAFTLLTQTTMPSWGYEVVNGATTMWERWDSIREDGSFQDPGMNSFNHYAFGAVGDWMYQNIGGIQPVDPGYKSMIIAPQVGGELTHA